MEQKTTFGTFKLKLPEKEITGTFTDEGEYRALKTIVNRNSAFKDVEYFTLSKLINGEIIEIDVLKEPIENFENDIIDSLHNPFGDWIKK
jgi:hypothetical protein